MASCDRGHPGCRARHVIHHRPRTARLAVAPATAAYDATTLTAVSRSRGLPEPWVCFLELSF